MNLDENFVGMWFMNLDSKSDLLISLVKEEDHFRITYRVRLYKDDSAFDSQDEKRWNEATFSGTKAEAIESIQKAVCQLERFTKTTADEILVDQRGVEGVIETLKTKEWAHMKTISKEEYEKGKT